MCNDSNGVSAVGGDGKSVTEFVWISLTHRPAGAGPPRELAGDVTGDRADTVGLPVPIPLVLEPQAVRTTMVAKSAANRQAITRFTLLCDYYVGNDHHINNEGIICLYLTILALIIPQYI